MDNAETTNYIINTLGYISKDISSLKENVHLLNQQVDSLNQQVGSLNRKVDSLDQKVDSLDQKVDNHYEINRKEHFEMKNMMFQMQKDIKDLRTDIDTVYDLENDSRKTIQKLL